MGCSFDEADEVFIEIHRELLLEPPAEARRDRVNSCIFIAFSLDTFLLREEC